MNLPYDAAQLGTIGYRIREERLRLDMTEKEFAEATGLGATEKKAFGRQRVQALETDSASKRKPLSYDELASMAVINVDVQYVLVGRRSQALTPDEQVLVDNYRASSEADRKSLRSVGNAFAKSRLMDDDAEVGGN